MEVSPIIFGLLMLPSVVLLIGLRKYGLASGLIIYICCNNGWSLLSLAAAVTYVTGYGIFIYATQSNPIELDLTNNSEE